MKQIKFLHLPDRGRETEIYCNCNEFQYSKHLAAIYDKVFEEYFRCRLIYSPTIGWVCEFEDIDYTWFMMKWS